MWKSKPTFKTLTPSALQLLVRGLQSKGKTMTYELNEQQVEMIINNCNQIMESDVYDNTTKAIASGLHKKLSVNLEEEYARELQASQNYFYDNQE